MRSRCRCRPPRPRRGAGARRDTGATSLELAMYMPILLLLIFFTVQESLLFLGNQAAGAAAREASRVARAEGGDAQGVQDGIEQGQQYAVSVGHGLIADVVVAVQPVVVQPGQAVQIRATVTARGVQIVPGFPGQRITQVAQGPVEGFRPDL